jgi:transcription-repair coupling factor (superfamily II helicase)
VEYHNLINLFTSHPKINKASELLKTGQSLCLTGLSGSARSIAISTIFQRTDNTFLVILNNEEDAGYFFHDQQQWTNDNSTLFFPSGFRKAVRYGQTDPANEILRTEVLSKLKDNNNAKTMIVTFPEALAEKVVSPKALQKNTLNIKLDEKINMTFAVELLDSYGFQRADYVYEPGQFATRGSILDIFSYANEQPYRIDFFGDRIESIRLFDVETQLSYTKISSATIISGKAGERETSILQYLPQNTIIILRNPNTIFQQIEAAWNQKPLPANDETTPSSSQIKQILTPTETIKIHCAKFQQISLHENPKLTTVKFSTTPQLPCRKNFNLAAEYFKNRQAEGYQIFILTENQKQTERIQTIFKDRGENIEFTPIAKTLHEGFTDNDTKICIFTDHQLFDRYHKYNLNSEKIRSGKIALSLKELKQFKTGDFVVHIDHGIGKFGGLLRTTTNGREHEVIKIIYRNDDFIFVNIHSLHKISKYKGKDNEPPALNKLGSKAWETLKARTKKKLKDIAQDLILLYSKRMQERGFSFSPDTYMQKELESSFAYEDTPDQLKATMDVKNDMENPRPMDRLICGDVGFGKTEIAIRAAFKAAADGKQVAVLVPTTLLACQHYNTFTERLQNMPVNVEYLSRARTPKETRQILQNLKEGKIEIIIGTHRLINKDVQFKDLGLLIIDEEQKFGVTVKEQLRELKTNIDTLTLTATPIPRTLQFSLMGARDLSNISTPPPNRYPVFTEVHRFDRDIIREAILFEMGRNGQTFIVHNRISTLEEIYKTVQREVPEARIAVGHGQIPPNKLEETIAGFVGHEYDVLLTTSIIENGIDIPNANTIIVNNAHNFGLSDLHQLRGRVGRGSRKAFCYLLAPPLDQLPPEARRRLQAIENFSELGSGIHIAMQDLDIRGAGNMLGSEQSGFIADLGYETYRKILSEAVFELKSELSAAGGRVSGSSSFETHYVSDTTIECDIDAHFPASYVPDSAERVLLYRELDAMEERDAIEQFRLRLIDRFGRIPPPGEELIMIVHLRRIARRSGIEKVILKSGKMTVQLITNPDSPYYKSSLFDSLIKFVQNNYHRTLFSEHNSRRTLSISGVKTVLDAVNAMEEITGAVPLVGISA